MDSSEPIGDPHATCMNDRARAPSEVEPLAWASQGSGPAVLWIQGVGVHGAGWAPQIAALAPRWRCVTFDHRGVGRSSTPPGRVSVGSMVDDALAVLDAAGERAAHVVGHSLGGLVALALAERAPERVRSLALLCTFANGREGGSSARMLWIGLRTRIGTRAMRRRAFLEIVLPPATRARGDLEGWAERLAPLFGHDLADHPAVEMRQLAAMRACDQTPWLAQLRNVPALVVSALHDPIAPPELGRKLAAGLARSRYVELADAAHGAPIEHAERVNALLEEHLRAASR